MIKYILVIGDGMADNPVPELGNRTPLEYVDIPDIHALAAKGIVGNVKNCPEGLPPGSDTAILSIFGADPKVCYTGRSPLEAAATGIKLKTGDVSYRCNMIALEDCEKPYAEKKILSHSGGSIDGESSIELIKYLFSDPEFKAKAEKAGMTVYPAPSFRHIAVQTGADIKGIKLAPPHDHLGEVIGRYLPSGCENAKTLGRLMELSNRVLDHHPINEARRKAGKLPANGVWFWAEGTGVELESFEKKYGRRGAVISAVPLCHGIARLSGLDVVEVEGATGELDTNLEGKVSACIQALADGFDFAAIHVEAPDECTHNGDTKGKLQAIEWLDSRVFVPLLAGLKKQGFDYRILFLSDHKTLTSTRGHDGDPVPFMIYDSRRDTGGGLRYTEADGLKGVCVKAGTGLMPMLFELN
jgi:2,3-bisphosphoglycerate-independent phosphoglycerate mutase